MILLQLLATALVAFGLWTFLGYGLARLLLPAPLRDDGALFAPLLGYALLLLVAYYGVSTMLSLQALLPLLFLLGCVLNLLAWQYGSPLRLRRWHGAVAALALCTYLSGVLPLLFYGLFAPIGENWDSEVYLPTADYLAYLPQSRIAIEAPPNPLNHAPANPPGAGLTLGFPCAHGLLALLTNTTALETLAPLLALLRALGAVSIALLARHVFGLRWRWSLVAGALVALHSVLLWSALFSFGMQLSAWPLFPLGITLLASALARPAPRSIALAALALAVIPVAYYPALTMFIPAAGGVAIAILFEARRQGDKETRRQGGKETPSPMLASLTLASPALASPILPLARLPFSHSPALASPILPLSLSPLLLISRIKCLSPVAQRLMAGIAIGLLSVVLAGLTLRDYYQGFSYRYGLQLTSLGIFEYAPLDVVLGLSPFGLNGSASPLPAPLAYVGTALVALLIACALVLSPFRWRWAGLIVGCVGYLLWLRFVRQYPYAFLKASGYAGPLLLLAAVGGANCLYRRGAKVQSHAYTRPLCRGIAGACMVVIGLCAWGAFATLRPYLVAEPRFAPRAAIEAIGPLRALPPGASLRLSDDHRLQGPTMGLLAYGALGHPLFGSLKTGFGTLKDNQTGQLGNYALLGVDESPARYGYAAADRRWSNALFALYTRPMGALAQLAPAAPGDTIGPGEALTVYAGADALSLHTPLAGGAGRSLSLDLATLELARLRIGDQTLDIAPGVGRFTSVPLDVDGALAVRNLGGATVYLRGVTLNAPGVASKPGWLPDTQTALLLPSTGATHGLANVDVRYINPTGNRVTVYLDIWDERAGAHFGWYGVELGPNASPQRLGLQLDTRTGAFTATLDGQGVVAGQQFVGLADGAYTARLGVLVGRRALAEPVPLFLLNIKGGAPQPIDAFGPRLLQAALWNPAQPTNLHLGATISLAGYDVSPVARAGQPLPLTLFWQANGDAGEELSALVHLRGPDGATLLTADGPPAGGARPTSTWRAGDRIRDERMLPLPTTLVPGRYTLAIGMYRWPSLERLPATALDGRLPDDVLLIPIEVR